MTTRYLLNEVVLFTPTDNTLQSINAEGGIIHLNNPASRCLLLLITKQPDTVSQKELFSFVWREQGANLATNTLYQNISLLRRALATSSGSLSDAIVTMPRVGFRLNPTICVKEIDNENVTFDKKNEAFEPRSFIENVTGILSSHHQIMNGMLFILIAIIWGVFGITQLSQKEDDSMYVDSYNKATEISGCTVYLPPAFIRADTVRIKLNIEKLKPDCSQYKHLYYNERSDRARISLMLCNTNVLKSADCITKIYWNE